MEEEVKTEKKHNKKENKSDKLIEELKTKIDLLEDKNRRTQAEFINFRTRTENEISNMFKFEGEGIIKDLLDVKDDFERAIMMDDNDLSDEVSKFLEGFKMIYTRLMSMFDKLDVKELDIEGKEFDPTVSEAVLTDHDESKPENVILEVLKKGYTYKGKLIRPAMVKVNK